MFTHIKAWYIMEMIVVPKQEASFKPQNYLQSIFMRWSWKYQQHKNISDGNSIDALIISIWCMVCYYISNKLSSSDQPLSAIRARRGGYTFYLQSLFKKKARETNPAIICVAGKTSLLSRCFLHEKERTNIIHPIHLLALTCDVISALILA